MNKQRAPRAQWSSPPRRTTSPNPWSTKLWPPPPPPKSHERHMLANNAAFKPYRMKSPGHQNRSACAATGPIPTFLHSTGCRSQGDPVRGSYTAHNIPKAEKSPIPYHANTPKFLGGHTKDPPTFWAPRSRNFVSYIPSTNYAPKTTRPTPSNYLKH